MSNVEILKKYEEKRCQIWNENRRLETRKINVLDKVENKIYEAFLNPINNYNDDVCLYSINDREDFKIITNVIFNSDIYVITNYEELVFQNH